MDKKAATHCGNKNNIGIKEDASEKIMVKRSSPRISTDVIITCRPYSSRSAFDAIDGVMANFSRQGAYIETPHAFKSGTILILRVVCYPNILSSMSEVQQPRSICLVEVKWLQKLADENAIRYGMGLRYLD